ncbi:MAG: hypothetical protein WD004_00310 [Actinomycetota bacterium]
MSRATVPSSLRKFVMLQPEVEGVLQRIGHGMWDLVVIDVDGDWTRWVFPSAEMAKDAGERLDIKVHEGWDPRMTRRMNSFDAWGTPGAKRRAL